MPRPLAKPAYKIAVRFRKTFIKGNLQGTSVWETMPHTNINQAMRWVESVKNTLSLDWVIDNVTYDML